MRERRKHIGVDSFFAERNHLLSEYAKAKKQTADDAVKTEHGNVAKALARKWLRSFLPRRFGVCKGYIITTDLLFEGPLEEWDVLIYDAIESPILYTRGSETDSQRRAVPVEHVRAVIEIKATLTPTMAATSASKLLKLKQYIGNRPEGEHPQFLCEPFVCAAVFFETRVSTLTEYRRALDALTELYQTDPVVPFMGCLVLRSQRYPDHSGYLQPILSETRYTMPDVFEMSTPFSMTDGLHGIFGTIGWGVNSYPIFLFDVSGIHTWNPYTKGIQLLRIGF